MPSHFATALSFTASLLCATPTLAGAPSPPRDPAQRVLKPGIYAVSCGYLGWGATKREALKHCNAKVRKSRHVSHERCECRKNADIIEVGPDDKPAWWVAHWTFVGATPEEAIAACEKFERAHPSKGVDLGLDCRAACRSAWGPFERRHEQGRFDDKTRYRWLTSDGEWLDEFGEGPCFVGDTPVLTPEGPRPIADIAVGDRVLARPAEGVAGERAATVVRTKRRAVDAILSLTLEDGRALGVTANHPLFSMSHGRFVPAGELNVGDRLAVRAGPDTLAPLAISAIVEERGKHEVYDLTVVPGRSLFAAGVWAHNY